MIKYSKIIMITEDEKIFDMIKIMRTKVELKEDDNNLILLHRAKDPDHIFIEEELRFWQENDMMRVTVSVEQPFDSKNGKGGVEESKEGNYFL